MASRSILAGSARAAAHMLILSPLLLAPAPSAAADPEGSTVVSDGSGAMEINTGRARLITLRRPMTDLFVADDSIADVQVRSPTQLYIYGKKPGETTISATGRGGAVVYSATVRVGNNTDSIGRMLRLAMPEAKIAATPINGMILLTGTVASPDDVAEAERLVQAYVGKDTRIISRLKTATPLQVNLQVRIAEVSRSFVKTIGVNLLSRDNSGGFLFGVASGRNAGTISDVTDPTTGQIIGTRYGFTSGDARTSVGLAGRVLGMNLLAAIDLGETLGQVSTLANPNLTALSGETATFLAGGEIPIPLTSGFGAVSVDYKQYGVSLSYTPTVLSDGRISLRVRPEVSQISSVGSVRINGTSIPALSTRRAETTLELGSGQSMMIGGLLSNTHDNSIEKAPWLGDLPLIGSLFRSNAFKRNETELVIIITPYLVKPVDSPSDIALPTDGQRPPNDAERVLLGRVAAGSGEPRPVPTMAPPVQGRPVSGAAAPVGAAPAARPGKAVPMPGFSE
ncbi:pilus assembly protein CpaC [Sphingomonas sp. SORGH_AS870]|uniref:type II and III secretion system protein family protein n=1 Tax=Sphingomonas sp. SORGH_AS_0870 TaxID=3041801 RepID=UPI00285A08A8|nr:type II and III secretion system protein family protein [Sphingomonas sp. SORGH_AS_0870]MDR6145389.1 pilus assembly protein CpaC [Sphingomonas sp. SORGH_AS_0870]